MVGSAEACASTAAAVAGHVTPFPPTTPYTAPYTSNPSQTMPLTGTSVGGSNSNSSGVGSSSSGSSTSTSGDRRFVSLRFLSWCLLGRCIQQHTHDSIEDATASLDLYSLAERTRARGEQEWERLKAALDEVGRRTHWQVPMTQQ